MGQRWDDILYEGSYDGIKFDFVSTRAEHANDLDQQRFPNRAGTKVVGRGEAGARHEVMAIFIEDDYPDSTDSERGMNKLIEKLRNGGAIKKFVHPIEGESNCAVDRFTVTHDVEDARDSATITITFIEDNGGEAGIVAIPNTAPARSNAIQSIGTDVLVALSAFQSALNVQNSDVGLAVTGAVNAANGIASDLQATGDDLSALRVQTMANGGLAKCDAAVVLLDDYATTEQYNLAAAIREMSAALRALATVFIEAKPPLSEHYVVADTNLLALVFDLYGSSERVEEVMTLNSIPDPSLIPVGYRLLHYAV